VISEFFSRLRFLLTRRDRGELDQEIQFHLEESIALKAASGLSAAEARREALIEFGGVERTREQCVRQRPGWWIGTVLQDVRYALRGFRRNPLFTISVLITLALGIGATTAVFSFVDLILFRPLPYEDPSRIVSVGFVHSLEREEFLMGRFFIQWQDHQRPFSALAGQSASAQNCDLVENNPAQLSCMSFQAGFLPLLGISPVIGRNFLPEEDRTHGPPVVMISYALWQGHYNGDRQILNRTIDINGSLVRVVGVLPKNFQFPTLQQADIIFPMALDRGAQQTVNGGFGAPMRVFARLKPGVTVAQAYAEMQPLFDSERKLFPAQARKEVRLVIRSLRDRETQTVRPVAWILFGFVLAVLMIACANVAGLMMARGAARQREIAVRAAVGASRGRLVRQALTEALLLSFAGAIAGLGAAKGLVTIFIALAPSGIPFLAKARLNLRVAVFTAVLSSICGAAFGLATALQKPRLERLNAKASISRSYALLRRALVMAQIAASIILLCGAALLLHSFEKIEDQNLGMQTGGVLTTSVALPWFRYNTNEKAMEFYLQLEAALRRLPGTRAVAVADSIPPGGWEGGMRFSDLAVQGKPQAAPGTGGDVRSRQVTPDYFRALDIPIIRGSGFSDRNRSGDEQEAVLSRPLAVRLFPGEDPVGKRIERVSSDGTWFTVTGVADNVKNGGLTATEEPEIYFLRRNVSADWGASHSIVIIDSVMPPDAVESWVQSAVASIDRTVPVEIEPLSQTVSTLADRPRFETALLAFFAFTGLVLAVVGLYGLIAFMTTQRRQEIGVRMALGATRSGILRLIAIEGLRLVLAGMGVGIGLALAVSQMLKALLFQVSTFDPLTFILVPLLLSIIALVAILIPARGGTRVDPAITLRAE
jgi:putative ABC transport system permease protein